MILNLRYAIYTFFSEHYSKSFSSAFSCSILYSRARIKLYIPVKHVNAFTLNKL